MSAIGRSNPFVTVGGLANPDTHLTDFTLLNCHVDFSNRSSVNKSKHKNYYQNSALKSVSTHPEHSRDLSQKKGLLLQHNRSFLHSNSDRNAHIIQDNPHDKGIFAEK